MNGIQKKIIYLILLTLFIYSYTIPLAYAAPSSNDSTPKQTEDVQATITEPIIQAKSAVVIDAQNATILYQKNKDEKAYPASITKILTAAIALEQGNLSDIITIDEEASTGIPSGSSAIVMDKGEQFTLKQLLYGLMLISGNDAAIAIAKYIAGSTEAFTDLMNKKAAEWGAKNSHFANPHGYHDPNHYTTAFDMAMIAKHAMNIPEFCEIVATTVYDDIPPTTKGEKRVWRNINFLIQPTSRYYYPNATGIKTGYTSEAGNTLVASAKKGDMELIAVLMGEATKQNSAKDAIALFDYCFEKFTRKLVAQNGTTQGTVKVIDGTPTSIDAIIKDNVEITLDKETAAAADIQSVIHLPVAISAPIQKDQEIGSVDYIINGQTIASATLIAADGAQKTSNPQPSLPSSENILSLQWLKILFAVILIAVISMLYFIKKLYNRNYRY